MKIKILVCCHKDDIKVESSPYCPIHVGKTISNMNLNIMGDDTGDNISSKNQSYCELTGMYWAWKNLNDVDIIGLCHYRRYFDFHKQCRLFMPFENFPTNEIDNLNFDIPDNILKKIAKGYVVTAKPFHYRYCLAIDYCLAHLSDDFRTLQRIIRETQSQKIVDAFDVTMYQNNTLIPCNMFLMNWNDFDAYCKWLFPLLNNVEDEIDISRYDSNQRRIFGYMGERLFNVWLCAERKKVIYKPIIKFYDGTDNYMHPMHFIINRLRGWMATALARTQSRL